MWLKINKGMCNLIFLFLVSKSLSFQKCSGIVSIFVKSGSGKIQLGKQNEDILFRLRELVRQVLENRGVSKGKSGPPGCRRLQHQAWRRLALGHVASSSQIQKAPPFFPSLASKLSSSFPLAEPSDCRGNLGNTVHGLVCGN